MEVRGPRETPSPAVRWSPNWHGGTVQAQPTDQRTPWGHAVKSLATANTCQAPRVPEGTAPSAPLGAHGATPGRRRKLLRPLWLNSWLLLQAEMLLLILTFLLLLASTPGSWARNVRRQSDTWGVWGEWSPCSRTCGGGVSFRERPCYSQR
ncbi:hypothetical protein U0070_026174 [Myodes glareolus]|uniref:Uncharacterized protein n=1 Tax=Myodes glareolus TaxID=447135 RepID=A0AAW0HX52_MYOGA